MQLAAVYVDPLEALERFVGVSRDLSDFAKRALLWLLRESHGLTRAVSLSFPPHLGFLGQLAASGVHDAVSANCTTHLNLFLHGMGKRFVVCSHAGGYRNNGEFDSHSGGYTIWVSPIFYDHKAIRLPFDLRVILATSLKNEIGCSAA